jgi:hypothetical protein
MRTLPPIVVPLRRFASDPERVRTELVFVPERAGDREIEVMTVFDGDGPSFVCNATTAREIAAELIARADRIDAKERRLDEREGQ